MKKNNKLSKFFKAIGRIVRHPYLLNLVLQDEVENRDEVIRKYGMSQGLPVVEIDDLVPDFDVDVNPYAFLSGATTSIDLALLRAVAKRYGVQDYFEIGTWRGESVANVAKVVPHCVTFNLPKEDLKKMTENGRYADLHGFFSQPLERVKHLYGDSQTFDFNPYYGKFDMVFVDGDHHYGSVLKDTDTAFRLLKDGHGVIVWHDYGLDSETVRWEVMEAILDGAPAEMRNRIYHISNTLCAAYLPESFPTHSLVPYEEIRKYFEMNIKVHKLRG